MDLNPPWIEFDRIPWGSIGWRMGFGEAHWSKWCSAFSELTGIQKAEYQLHWPEPEGWKGFYDFIEHGTLQPHVVEREARVKAAARIPSADEHAIVDPDRVQWMIKHYLKKPQRYVAAIDSGPRDVLFRDPAGDTWLLVIPDAEAVLEVPYLMRYSGKMIGEGNLGVVRPIP